ncbi:PREDICTED: trypsin-1-like [Ceratosolen solmsi marchali]|uniref:Trypsin-1-like n=1 Tax=Ceratosolen solmsi marchali TaxID=326594 RepID=A0AAJ6YQ91_9HYME|nr:PREDICTED: trypsin-1-like [Ceratosolen solmsi marchali]
MIGYSIKDNSPTSTFIIGGEYDTIEHHPYLVAILKNERLWCGGSILSVNHVLTAAHCVLHESSPLIVSSGSAFWKQGSIHHVEYNVTYGPVMNDDLAILRVTEHFIFDNTCQPIPIFYSGEITDPGTMATISGWGITENDSPTLQLKSTQVPVVDTEVCSDIYKDSDIGIISEGQMCAGFLDEGGKDACQGDSGGPLVIDGRQAGIVSMGYGCAKPHYPGVYTRVAFYNSWIMEQISL